MSSAALADDPPKFGYSITITGVSDYLFRGQSLTSGDPAFQPFIEFTYGNPKLTWYLDFWGSNVKNDINGGATNPLEVDVYAGVRPVTGPVSWDLGVLYYTNPTSRDPGAVDYVEFKVAASITPITNLTLMVVGYATPDQGANYAQTETIEFDPSYTMPQVGIFTPTVSGGVGWTTSPRASFFAAGRDNYTYWNAGVKLSVDKFFMDFRYWATDISEAEQAGACPGVLGACRNDSAPRFLFSAGVNLP
jgi:uncharacterized protein (TIGR02001 family)